MTELENLKHGAAGNGSMAYAPRYRSGAALDYLLRLLALAATLSAAIVMGLSRQSVSIFGVSLQAKFHYSPAFTFFVVANATAGLYALLSLAMSFNIAKARSPSRTKLLMFFFDMVMTVVVTAGASAATAIAYVGRKGNSHVGWIAICDQFGKFCDYVGGALIASFLGVLIFMTITVSSTVSLSRSIS